MVACTALFLAQAPPVAGHSSDLIRWIIVLAVGTAAFILAGFLIYRIVMRSLAEPESGPSFDLLELRRLRDSGALTEEEFEKAKDRVVAELSGPISGGTGASGGSGVPGSANSDPGNEPTGKPPATGDQPPPPPDNP
jgi:hypothetical protein